ncbi:MAG: PASTA domain-containing protein [Flavobacteriales bacterium]
MFKKENLKTFLIAFVAMAVVSVLLFMGLKLYTRHSNKILVPDVTDMQIEEAGGKLEAEGLEAVVTDTMYMADKKEFTVLDQNPKFNSEVKSGRKVYLVISSNNPPEVEVPDMKDLSEREARAQLEARGFKVGKVIQVPQFGGVLGLAHKGQLIPPRTKVPKGTTIDIRVGRYTSDDDTTTVHESSAY